jgi:GTP cyclohydrolase I
MRVNREAAEHAIREFLRALGHDPDQSPELRQTPARVARAFCEDLLSGYAVDIAQLISSGTVTCDQEPPPGLVAVRDLAVATVCPHHLTPSWGKATVAYAPGARLLGVGTLAKLVDACARRLALQEEVGQCVVDALVQHGGARGALCRLSLRHGCLCARGARQPDALVHTVATSGTLSDPAEASRLAVLLQPEATD